MVYSFPTLDHTNGELKQLKYFTDVRAYQKAVSNTKSCVLFLDQTLLQSLLGVFFGLGLNWVFLFTKTGADEFKLNILE